MPPTPTGGFDSYLPPDDPNYRQYVAACQFEADERAKQIAAVLIDTCPRGIRHDPVLCAEFLQGPAAALVINAVIEQGEKDAEVHLENAEAATIMLAHDNDRLARVNRDRRDLAEDIIEGAVGRITRAENRAQLAVNQHVAGQRDLAGDREHRRVPGAGWLGTVVAVVVAVLETVVTLRIFNISFSHLVFMSFLPWLALTVGLGLFNTFVTAYLGRRRRDARELQKARVALNTRGYSQTHYPNGAAS
jgi:hypothetical protein